MKPLGFGAFDMLSEVDEVVDTPTEQTIGIEEHIGNVEVPQEEETLAGLEDLDKTDECDDENDEDNDDTDDQYLDERIVKAKQFILRDPDIRKNLDNVPIMTNVDQTGKIIYEIIFKDVVYEYTDYIQLISLLDNADENTEFRIYIGSPGGSVSIGAQIGSAMLRTKANVITVAHGHVCSIAMFIWSCGKQQAMSDNAFFMLHMSSEGMGRNYSTLIKERAERTIAYVTRYLLGISLDKKHLNQEEYDSIVNDSVDIYVTVEDMKQRCIANGTYVEGV